jgi:hypothetical protein
MRTASGRVLRTKRPTGESLHRAWTILRRTALNSQAIFLLQMIARRKRMAVVVTMKVVVELRWTLMDQQCCRIRSSGKLRRVTSK